MGHLLMGYFLGLFVALMALLASDSMVPVQQVEKAQAICLDNKGLKKLDKYTIVCNNGATFEKGDVK